MSTATMTHLFGLPETIEKFVFSSSRPNDGNESRGAIPVDILETPKEYIFHLDIPGISKSDIQNQDVGNIHEGRKGSFFKLHGNGNTMEESVSKGLLSSSSV